MKKLLLLILVMMFSSFFTTLHAQEKKKINFIIYTKYGKIYARLYDDTPIHRDNFIKLVNEGWYDSSRFHRVMKGSFIQGGANKHGQLDPGYKIEQEIRPGRIHKRGAIGMARQGDKVNPDYFSSACQFYIVTGRKYTDEELQNIEEHYDYKMSDKQRKIYLNQTGAAQLDRGYTVFAEVTRGMNVVDKITEARIFGTEPDPPIYIRIEIFEDNK